jgi:hypothetical protein
LFYSDFAEEFVAEFVAEFAADFTANFVVEFVEDNEHILAFEEDLGMKHTKLSDFLRILNVVLSLMILLVNLAAEC